MSKEVVQPQISKPDLDDMSAWALWPSIRSAWIEQVAPQLGLDTEKLLLGEILGNIIGDDENSFGIDGQYFVKYVELSRTFIYTRMDWETQSKYLPENIKERIQKVRQQMETMEWYGKDNFEKVRQLWVTKVRNFTRHQMALHKELRDVVHYDFVQSEILSPPWREFIGDKIT